jgi:hypothetical protein
VVKLKNPPNGHRKIFGANLLKLATKTKGAEMTILRSCPPKNKHIFPVDTSSQVK